MQNYIEFTTQSSTTIFSKLVQNTRKYCMKKTKKISEKMRQSENQAIQELITTRTAMNAKSPPTEPAISDYEKAQERLLLQQTKIQQAASDINFTNLAAISV